MSTLEDDLRRLLADPRRDPPAWPDASQRVRAGMRRRHVRRVAAAGGAAALAVLLVTAGVFAWARPAAGPGPAGPSPSATASDVVAFRDLPFATYPPVRLDSRPATTACRTQDLTVAIAPGGGAAGTSFLNVQVHNAGAGRCTLSGRPVLLYRAGSGRLVPGQTHDVEPHPATDASNNPATIDPGEVAQLTLEQYGGCLVGQPSITYPDATLRLADGGQLTLPLDRPLDATCGVGITEWYRPVPAVAPFYPWLGLRVSLDLPTEVHIGETMEYVVTLSNPWPKDVALQPCPNYLAQVSGTKAGGLNQLNCAVSVIPAGGQQRFAMRLLIPPYVGRTGPVTVTWTLDKGAAEGTAPEGHGTVTIV